ncbi:MULTISPECIES: hypothetical protein [unclassified Coleofasciculus]|uniref:hypothetical protein n=1 Tax=unclassified Coleofasciculus TaxID=2692782 RepID=UPI00187E67E3|nr:MULTISPECIES: hypothetical protein [unclassified Coleofasciculus]MBE9125371.1 hypothetical protein [Coleofasciculus sp. LEGE 07081]MBE9147412.1 hypothetical protein [Coleofasciculus sp. LEGE 07092]
MSISPSLKTIIESIEALSLEDQALLFEQLYKRRLEKQLQDNVKEIAETREQELITSKSPQSQNPLLQVPATLKNNPLFDEVLEYIEAYRHELDQETEAYYRERDAEVQAK